MIFLKRRFSPSHQAQNPAKMVIADFQAKCLSTGLVQEYRDSLLAVRHRTDKR
ncbi:hypothetical protein [Bradyrhizobium macuxiense]|uniref:hypothetical protein n=1 Tax=Bradyrhizobium macuxiense TaxID=1755647 RepID=UPI001365BF7D|nr:hypothetical protein [Bradyrhizobium macuxiense]